MRHTWQNHVYMWKMCFGAAPGFMLYTLYDAFRYQFLIFVEHTLAIRYVLRCAEYGEPFYKAAIVVGITLLLNMIAMVPDGYFQNALLLRSKPKIYQALKNEMYKKAAELDLSCYDDPEYYNDFVLAVAEAESCVDRFLELVNLLVQSLTIVLTTGAFFIMTDVTGVFFVIVSFVLSFVFMRLLNKLNYNVRLKLNPLIRRRNYTSRVFYLNDYAKELRLYPEVGDVLEQDFTDTNIEMETEQRKVAGKRTGLLFAQGYCAGDFILDGLYITYLIFQAAVLRTIDYSNAVILFNNTGRLRRGMRGFAEAIPKANENSMYIDKIRSFLSYEPVIKHGVGEDVPTGAGEIHLENVSFAYSESTPEILHDITLHVTPGEKIAIVGYNGAGKTTLIKLLMRLYDPTSGTISYHGKDIRSYNLDEYHKRIGVVFQDFKMYGATLLENVLLDDVADPKAEETAVTEALERSGFGERLATLEDGLYTPITTEFDEKGVNLSGGESQKVAIARAFYKQADILIMDEPSSALDPIAEYNLNKAMHAAAENKTVFYISHRLSTTRDADRIIMLENGRIIEEGTHAALLAKNGKYAKMWHVQAGKYMETE